MAIVVAVCLAALAGWYAINGLLVLFPDAGWSIVATGMAVETGEVFVAGYVARAWNDTAWPCGSPCRGSSSCCPC